MPNLLTMTNILSIMAQKAKRVNKMEDNILHIEPDDANYKEMYLTMMRASEKAIRILIKAQQTCEEMYLNPKKTEPPIDFERLIK